jgi:Na+-translocating ferredoxin:NAD+ oxidoreductase RnfE subunit
MTVKDGFKLGIGIALSQLLLGAIVLVLSFGALATVGVYAKQKAVQMLLEQGDK